MAKRLQTDEEIIAGLGVGRLFAGRRRGRPGRLATPVLRWTDADNLRGREACVRGGHADGLLVMVREQNGRYRYPNVIDLDDYLFHPETWTFRI